MSNYRINGLYLSVISLLATFLCSCSPGSEGGGIGFNTIGSTILGSTGIVSGSQADSIFSAGGKLAKSASGFTPEQEYYLGRGVSATIFSRYKPLRNQSVNQYVNRVGNTVAAFSDKPETFGGYHFIVLDTPEINAMAAPGGFIFVTKGFVKLLPDEDALAAVLAHEVGHVVIGHGVKAISQANLTEALLIIGKETAASQGGFAVEQLTSAFGDSITDVFDTLITNGYSRSQEYAADKYAAELLAKSGYTPAALIETLDILEQARREQKGGWYETHPKPNNRIGELQDELEKVVEKPQSPSQAQIIRAGRFKSVMKSMV